MKRFSLFALMLISGLFSIGAHATCIIGPDGKPECHAPGPTVPQSGLPVECKLELDTVAQPLETSADQDMKNIRFVLSRDAGLDFTAFATYRAIDGVIEASIYDNTGSRPVASSSGGFDAKGKFLLNMNVLHGNRDRVVSIWCSKNK